ncbi:unnamed protein product [Parajaminaea phylloscopi]
MTEAENTLPNFFCRPAKGKKRTEGSNGTTGSQVHGDAPVSDAHPGLHGDGNGADDTEPPRLGFLREIVDHHTRARDIRNSFARMERTTNAWNMPIPGRQQPPAPQAPPTAIEASAPVETAPPSHGSDGGDSGGGKSSTNNTNPLSDTDTSATNLSTPASSRSPSVKGSSPSPGPEAGGSTTGTHPTRGEAGRSEGSGSSGEDQSQTGAGSNQRLGQEATSDGGSPAKPVEEEEEEEEEEPWFSQLASLPHLRSAGIPLLQPSMPGSALQSRAPPVAPSPTASLVMATASSSSAGGSTANGRSATSSSLQGPRDGLPLPARDLVTALEEQHLEPLRPPDNFAMVNSWLYRSSFPKKKHFPFLRKLGLKSVLTLILEEYPELNTSFLDEEGITFYQFGIPGNKEPFVQIPDDKIAAALVTMLDRRNHPMLIHCNKGKHRTGCLIGCLRKLQSWSLTTIFDEYRRFSFPKSRSMDQEFIELFDEREVWRMYKAQSTPDEIERWLPRWSVLDVGRQILGIGIGIGDGSRQHVEATPSSSAQHLSEVVTEERTDSAEILAAPLNSTSPSTRAAGSAPSPGEDGREGSPPAQQQVAGPSAVIAPVHMRGM